LYEVRMHLRADFSRSTSYYRSTEEELMKKIRLLVSVLLAAAALGSSTACTSITAVDEMCSGDIPGSNSLCDL